MAHSMKAAVRNVKLKDEMYTPRMLVNPILPFIHHHCEFPIPMDKKDLIVLCPFDKENSEFVQLISQAGYTVKYGHIDTGQDFFTHDYGNWDVCVSNPPFSKKKAVYEKLFATGKPWAMLGNMMQINYEEIGRLFADNPVQILSFDRRVSFDGNPSSFMCGYFCNKFLFNRDLIFLKLPHNNVGDKFIASRMYGN